MSKELKDSLDAYLKDIDDKHCLEFRLRFKSLSTQLWNTVVSKRRIIWIVSQVLITIYLIGYTIVHYG